MDLDSGDGSGSGRISVDDELPVTESDRLFREFLELQEAEGQEAALARFRSEHPAEAAHLGAILDDAAVLEAPTVSDGPEGNGGTLDARLLQPLKGRYRIERFLARGGMGDVYLATDTRVDALVAVKVFHRSGDADLRRRFLREARVGGRLSHRQRGTARVNDLDELEDGTPFLVMEYVEGRSLAEVLRDGPLPPDEVAALVGRLAETLGAIHADGVVHCDLKPSNLILRPLEGGGYEPVLIDFGVARVRGPLQIGPDTRSGEFRGTMSYAAPESLEGQSGPASDQFSLAVLAWEALAGRKAFPSEGLAALVDEIRERRLPRLDSVHARIPPAMARAIDVALSKRPEERFPTVVEFGRAVRAGSSTLAPAERPRGVMAGVSLGLGAALVVATVAWSAGWSKGPQPVLREPASHRVEAPAQATSPVAAALAAPAPVSAAAPAPVPAPEQAPLPSVAAGPPPASRVRGIAPSRASPSRERRVGRPIAIDRSGPAPPVPTGRLSSIQPPAEVRSPDPIQPPAPSRPAVTPQGPTGGGAVAF